MRSQQKKSILAYTNQNILFIFLVFLGLFLVVNLVPRTVLRNNAIENSRIVEAGLKMIVTEKIDDIEHFMNDVDVIIYHNDLAEQKAMHLLCEHVENHPLIKALELLDDNGRVIFAIPNDTVGMDRSGENIFQQNITPGQFYWSDVYTYLFSGDSVVNVAGRYDNYLMQVYVDLESFSTAASSIQDELEGKYSISVMDTYGTYVMNSNLSLISQRAQNAEFKQIVDAVAQNKFHFESSDQQSIVCVEYIEELDWYIALYANKSIVFGTINLVNIIWICSSSVLAIILWFYHRRNIKFSKLLLKFSEEVNDFSNNMEIIPRMDIKFLELDQLNQNFHSMSENLSNAISRESKAELKFLKSQIQPHFINNSLNTIISIMRHDVGKSRALLIQFSRYLRSCYDFDSLEDTIPIENELSYIESYLALEKARFQDKLIIEYDIDAVTLSVPPLILQPLVENAVIHGARNKSTGGLVRIYVHANGAFARLGVRDNGGGIDEAKIESIMNGTIESKRIGIYNINQRLGKLYGTSLHFSNLQNGGLDVYMEIPIQI